MAFRLLTYLAKARSINNIHSPFLFSFLNEILKDQNDLPAFKEIESLRKRLLQDSREFEVMPLGANSISGIGKRISLRKWVKNTAKSPRFGKLFFHIARYLQPSTIIELGTSAGISSLYLAKGYEQSRLITLEGNPDLAHIARENFKALGAGNIKLVEGNFDETLSGLLNEVEKIDLAFIDGNHREEPTLRYFNQILTKANNETVLLIDDIHWSGP